tara:strand:- start:16 stop:354 length:339 start_codon:yes stop_codon:yes gene_type:complete
MKLSAIASTITEDGEDSAGRPIKIMTRAKMTELWGKNVCAKCRKKFVEGDQYVSRLHRRRSGLYHLECMGKYNVGLGYSGPKIAKTGGEIRSRILDTRGDYRRTHPGDRDPG